MVKLSMPAGLSLPVAASVTSFMQPLLKITSHTVMHIDQITRTPTASNTLDVIATAAAAAHAHKQPILGSKVILELVEGVVTGCELVLSNIP